MQMHSQEQEFRVATENGIAETLSSRQWRRSKLESAGAGKEQPKRDDAGAGRGSRTPKTRRSADFESAASASSAIPAFG